MSAAEEIGRALKGRHNGTGWLVRCPCPAHGNGRGDRSPSLSVHDSDDGRLLLRCFAGCEFGDVLAALRNLGLAGDQPKLERARAVLRVVDPTPAEHLPDTRALQIWHSAKPAGRTVVQEYLERRGIPFVPPSIRLGTHVHLGRYSMPAMVGAVQRPDGVVVAVQATILTPKGDKAVIAIPKITTGALGAGAVRFAKAAPVMGIAEGIETAMSAQALADMPVWAALGCQRLQRVELPEIVKEVHVFGDNDMPGRDAAQRAAEVHLKAGRRVVLRFPPEGIKDFNDLLNADADDALRDLPISSKTGAAA